MDKAKQNHVHPTFTGYFNYRIHVFFFVHGKITDANAKPHPFIRCSPSVSVKLEDSIFSATLGAASPKDGNSKLSVGQKGNDILVGIQAPMHHVAKSCPPFYF